MPASEIREGLEKVIRENPDPETAALKACVFLNDLGLSLYGNGWLDDDAEAINAIRASGEAEDDD